MKRIEMKRAQKGLAYRIVSSFQSLIAFRTVENFKKAIELVKKNLRLEPLTEVEMSIIQSNLGPYGNVGKIRDSVVTIKKQISLVRIYVDLSNEEIIEVLDFVSSYFD